MNTTWARLIDRRSKTILAEARCIPTQLPPRQLLDQMLVDQAQGIKAGLAAYVQPCIEQHAAKMKV